jgi:hypothetical protein
MHVSNFAPTPKRFMGFGDMSWEAWCDQTWGSNPEINQKCHNKPWGIMSAAPWTEVGAIQRGIPKLNPSLVTDFLSVVGTGGAATPAQSGGFFSTSGNGIFGIPKMVLYVGGGVLVLGVIASVATRRGRRKSSPSVAGYSRRKRRNRRR